MNAKTVRSDLANLIDAAAYIIWKRYRGVTEPADIRQEMWAWVLTQKPTKVEELDARVLGYKLRDAGELYARKEKAARGGYSPSDEVFYSITTLRELLPLAVSTEPVALRREGEATGSYTPGVSPSMEFETTLADVRRAYRRLSTKYREILAEYVADPDASDEVQVRRALRYMQRKLGGRRPRKENL